MNQANMNRKGSMDAALDAENDPDDADFYGAAVMYGRKRRYREALDNLERALERGECSEEDALDLQARMFVQQGRLVDAEACWTKAQAINGSNTAYADALARLRYKARPVSRLYPFAAGALVLTLPAALVFQSAIAARDTAQQIELRCSEVAQTNAGLAKINSDQYTQIEAKIMEVDNNLKLLAKSDEVRNTRELFRTEIERVAAAVNSLESSLAAQNAVNKKDTAMIRGQFDSALEQIKGDAAAFLVQLDDRLNRLLKNSQSNPDP